MLLTHCHICDNGVDEYLTNFIAEQNKGKKYMGKVEGQNPSDMLSKKMLKPLPT